MPKWNFERASCKCLLVNEVQRLGHGACCSGAYIDRWFSRDGGGFRPGERYQWSRRGLLRRDGECRGEAESYAEEARASYGGAVNWHGPTGGGGEEETTSAMVRPFALIRDGWPWREEASEVH